MKFKCAASVLIIIFTFTGSLNSGLFAQQPSTSYTLKGLISDATTGKPLEFATIALKKMRDSSLVSGTISAATGEFKLENIPAGGYFIEIAFIGYDKHVEKVGFRPQSSPPITDMGKIALKVSANMLEGAEIVADKSFVMNNIDRKTYNTDQLSVATGGSVNDILQNLPSVEVDADGNVSLRGNENVTILIDGRPSGLTGAGGKSLLESLPASAIEKVEVISNPSAKYDPDGISGIINIITKKNKLKGLTGNVGASTNFDKGYGANGSLNYREGKFNIYSNFGYNYNIRHSSTESTRSTYFPDGISILSQDGEGETNSKSYNIKAGVDYNMTDKATLTLSALLNNGKRTYDEFLWYEFSGDGVSAGDSLYRRDTEGNSENGGVDLELAFRKYFSKPGRVLNIAATSSNTVDENASKYDQQVYYNESVVNPFVNADLQNDFTEEANDIYTLSADYEHPISEDKKIEGGYKSTFRHIDNDFRSEFYDYASDVFINDTDLTNRFIYDDGVHALYAQYRQSVGKFGIQAGLRSEYAQRESELKNTGEKFTKDYFSVFPSAFISYKPNLKYQFKTTYSRRINRPRTGQLNPFASYDDPLNIRTGNPDLDPEYTDSYELEANRIFDKYNLNLTATLYYRYTHDPIQRYRVYDAETGIANVTFENINSSENLGLEIILNANLYKWWSFTFSSNIYQNTVDASNLEQDLGSSDIAVSTRIFTTFKLPYKTEFQLTYSYRAPFEVTQGKMQEMQMTNMALSKKLLKDKLTATLRVSDPFNTQKFAMVLDGENYSQDFVRRRDTRTFTFALNWRFGELKDKDARPKREVLPKEDLDMGM